MVRRMLSTLLCNVWMNCSDLTTLSTLATCSVDYHRTHQMFVCIMKVNKKRARERERWIKKINSVRDLHLRQSTDWGHVQSCDESHTSGKILHLTQQLCNIYKLGEDLESCLMRILIEQSCGDPVRHLVCSANHLNHIQWSMLLLGRVPCLFE
jgi:hypothetical protein